MHVPQLTILLSFVMKKKKNTGKNMLACIFLYDSFNFMNIKIKPKNNINIFKDSETKRQTVLPRLCPFMFTGVMRETVFPDPRVMIA